EPSALASCMAAFLSPFFLALPDLTTGVAPLLSTAVAPLSSPTLGGTRDATLDASADSGFDFCTSSPSFPDAMTSAAVPCSATRPLSRRTTKSAAGAHSWTLWVTRMQVRPFISGPLMQLWKIHLAV